MLKKTIQQIKYSGGDLRPLTFERRKLPVECMALNSKGEPCKCYTLRGQAFCHSHLQQGYGLFTLAVLKAKDGTK